MNGAAALKVFGSSRWEFENELEELPCTAPSVSLGVGFLPPKQGVGLIDTVLRALKKI